MPDLNDVFGYRPDRPTHPDMAKLVNIVLRHDGLTEDADFSVGDYMAATINPDVLVYMAKQRVLRVLGPDAPPELFAKLATIFVDGFMTGAHWAQRDTTND